MKSISAFKRAPPTEVPMITGIMISLCQPAYSGMEKACPSISRLCSYVSAAVISLEP